ncbi:MAG: hypothetical protein ACKO8Q_04660, partial [Bacteroidota bacterium]
MKCYLANTELTIFKQIPLGFIFVVLGINLSHMDYTILELFIKENHAWDHMINRQRLELPQLDAMISNVFEERRGRLRDQSVRIFDHLK